MTRNRLGELGITRVTRGFIHARATTGWTALVRVRDVTMLQVRLIGTGQASLAFFTSAGSFQADVDVKIAEQIVEEVATHMLTGATV